MVELTINSVVEFTVDGCRVVLKLNSAFEWFRMSKQLDSSPVVELFLLVLQELRGVAVWLATLNQSVLKQMHSTELMTVI